jgi:hypothetical protein
MRALQGGAKLRISRAVKYSDVTNPNSATGAKASTSVTQTVNAAVGSTGTLKVGGPASGADTLSVIAEIPGMPSLVLASSIAVTNAETGIAIAAAINTGINASTATTHFSSTNTASTDVIVSAPVSMGAFGNNVIIKVLSANGKVPMATNNVKLAGGHDATVATGTLNSAASSVGAWGDKIDMQIIASVTGSATYDIAFSVPGTSIPAEYYKGFPVTGLADASTQDMIDAMIAASNIISSFVLSATYVFQPTSIGFQGGDDSDAMAPTDYIGDSNASTGIYAFNDYPDISKLCVPAVADPALDAALADYADLRQDIMVVLRTPIGLQPDKNLQYRNGTGSYSHRPVDSWRAIMSTGGLNVPSPFDASRNLDISEIADLCAKISNKDNKYGQWWSFSGIARGTVSNANNVLLNVGVPARRISYDAYDTNGLIPVIQNSNKQIYFSGNPTLYQGATTFLRKAEVAELVTFIYRVLNIIIPPSLFDPNDVQTWKDIYRRVQPFMEMLKNNRAIWDYEYQGDQDIMEVSQAVVNQPANIDAGMYVFNLLVKPKVALKYIQVNIALTASGVSFQNISVA